MILAPEQLKEFGEKAKPMIEWLNNNCYPHCTVVIDCTGAQLTEGVCSIRTDEYIKD